MDITEFFDINNEAHLRAYQHLNSTGNWPEEFYQELQAQKLTFSPGWIFGIQYKLAGAYVDMALNRADRDAAEQARKAALGRS